MHDCGELLSRVCVCVRVCAAQFAERAFWVLDAQNPFRVWCAQVILHPWFDNVILFVILLNAAFMLFAEYDKVYLSGDNVGDLDPSDSVGNNLNIKSDIYFTVIFTLELLVKVRGTAVPSVCVFPSVCLRSRAEVKVV